MHFAKMPPPLMNGSHATRSSDLIRKPESRSDMDQDYRLSGHSPLSGRA
jgi:hypothetical protein